jgi:hypothetical protein
MGRAACVLRDAQAALGLLSMTNVGAAQSPLVILRSRMKSGVSKDAQSNCQVIS